MHGEVKMRRMVVDQTEVLVKMESGADMIHYYWLSCWLKWVFRILRESGAVGQESS